MNDDAMDLMGRRVPSRSAPPAVMRDVAVPSRVVRRRDIVLAILDAAYRRDAGTREIS